MKLFIRLEMLLTWCIGTPCAVVAAIFGWIEERMGRRFARLETELERREEEP